MPRLQFKRGGVFSGCGLRPQTPVRLRAGDRPGGVIARSGEFASLRLAVSPAGIRRMDANELGNLVFSRRPGQKFVVDGNIEITVVRVNGNKVRLGVRAPLGVQIVRSELLEEVPDEVPEATAEPIAG